jgi:broad specificity phosphatase PhoE
MRLYLLRHGQTDWNASHRLQGQTDIPLNPEGIRQAEKEAARAAAKGITFDRVFTSPLIRARQTAQIVSGLTGEGITEDKRLLEMSFGPDEGTFYSFDPKLSGKMSENHRNFAYHPQAYQAPEGAESFGQLISRTSDFLKSLLETYGNTQETILVVSHGAALHAMLFTMLARTDMEEYWQPRIGNCRLMSVVRTGGAVILTEDSLCEVLRGAAGGGDLYVFGREKGKRPEVAGPARYAGLISASVDAGLRPDADFTIGGSMGKDRILLLAEKEAEAAEKIVTRDGEELITGNAQVTEDGKGGYDALLPAPSGEKAVLSLITYPKMRVVARGFAPVNPKVQVTALPDELSVPGGKRAEILLTDLPEGMGEIWLSFRYTAVSGRLETPGGRKKAEIPGGLSREIKVGLSSLDRELLKKESCRLILTLYPDETGTPGKAGEAGKAESPAGKVHLPHRAGVLCVRRIHVID